MGTLGFGMLGRLLRVCDGRDVADCEADGPGSEVSGCDGSGVGVGGCVDGGGVECGVDGSAVGAFFPFTYTGPANFSFGWSLVATFI